MQDNPYGAYDVASNVDGPSVIAGPGLWDALSRFRWVILTTAVAAAVLVYGVSLLQSKTYQAESSMLLTDPRTSGVFDNNLTAISDLSRYVRNQATFAESSAVAARAATILDDTLSLDVISDSVSAVAARDLDLVVIRATHPTPEGAAGLADAVGEAYRQLTAENVQQTAAAVIDELTISKTNLQSRVDVLDAALRDDPENAGLQAERDAAVAQLINLDTRIAQIDVNTALYGSGVQYFEPAEIPTQPSSPKPLRNAAAAAVLGLLAAGLYAWWRSERTPIVEHRHEPAPFLGAPLLGEVPDFEDIGVSGPAPVIHEPDSVAADAYRFVASSVDFALERIGGTTVVVTSAGSGDGKTVTSLNLAAAAAGNGSSVLLVDGDERVRGLTRMGGDDSLAGLADLVRRNDLGLADCLIRWKVGPDRHITVLPAGGTPNGSVSSLHGAVFAKVMTELKAAARFVVVDSPPVLAAAESLDIASHVDGIVVVIEKGTPFRVLVDMRARLEMTGRPLLGYIFNRAPHASSGHGKSYAYGYGYGR